MTACEQAKLDLAAAQERQAAYLNGTMIESIQYGEKRIGFNTKFSYGDLQRRIDVLQAMVDACNGVTRTPRRIIGIIPQG